MENHTLQIEMTTPDQTNGVKLETSMKNKLGLFSSVYTNNCCIIYKVPEFMREGNQKSYRPSIVSIGPIFYQEPQLEAMQEVKWIYLKCFLEHPDNAYPSLEHYIDYVREKEREIRRCYQEQKKLSRDEFIEMIVLDAAFLIYLFKCATRGLSLDSTFLKSKVQGNLLRPAVYRDILVVENQLPFFILNDVYGMAFGKVDKIPDSFIHLTLRSVVTTFLGEKSIDGIIDGNKITEPSNILHLVDLLCLSYHLLCNERRNKDLTVSVSCAHNVASWICLLVSYFRRLLNKKSSERDDYDGIGGVHPYTAKQLNNAGVKFVRSESDNPLDITFWNGKLKIPMLLLSDGTESQWRNILYYEQSHHYLRGTYFTDYILFLDALINTVEDVQVLVENKIIDNDLGSDEDTLQLFNKVGRNWAASSSFYNDISRKVNAYASTPWNRWMATLRTKYFYNPWVTISVIAAFVLFILTLLQTIASYAYK